MALLARRRAYLALGFGFLAAAAGCGTRCTSWIQLGLVRLEIKQCADDVAREVRCEGAAGRYRCECVVAGTVVSTFERVQGLPAFAGGPESVDAVNQGCAWKIKR